jgi:hypothetical protein
MLDLAAALPVRRCLPGEALGLRAGLSRRDQRSHGGLLRGIAWLPVGLVPAALRAAVKRLWRKLPHAARQRQTESMGVPWEMTGEAELVWL